MSKGPRQPRAAGASPSGARPTRARGRSSRRSRRGRTTTAPRACASSRASPRTARGIARRRWRRGPNLALHQPLTWAALTARARLAEAGAAVPPWMPADAAAPRPAAVLDLRLPPAPALLASLGLDGDAESRLSAEEREAIAPYAGREGEALCGLYGLLSRAKRRYRVGIHAVEGSWLLRAPSAGRALGVGLRLPAPLRLRRARARGGARPPARPRLRGDAPGERLRPGHRLPRAAPSA